MEAIFFQLLTCPRVDAQRMVASKVAIKALLDAQTISLAGVMEAAVMDVTMA